MFPASGPGQTKQRNQSGAWRSSIRIKRKNAAATAGTYKSEMTRLMTPCLRRRLPRYTLTKSQILFYHARREILSKYRAMTLAFLNGRNRSWLNALHHDSLTVQTAPALFLTARFAALAFWPAHP